MDMTVNWYAEIKDDEMEALAEYNRNMQYKAADKEEYTDAGYYKDRADEWKRRIGKKLKIVEESR
jgi:hypothetical protein